MQIDFRNKIDPWCQYSPKFLVCDRTHVGISVKKLYITTVEQAELSDKITPGHKRYDRVFLPYNKDVADEDVRTARKHLR